MRSVTAFNRLLAIFFTFIGVMIFARIVYSGSIRYIFLCWNIFLAWIPYILSCFFVVYKGREKWKRNRVFFFTVKRPKLPSLD